MISITTKQLQRFILQTFCIASIFALSTYAWVRILLFDIPFDIAEDTTIMGKMILISWGLIAALSASFHLIVLLSAYGKAVLTKFVTIRFQLPRLITIGFAVLLFSACNVPSTGIKKDLNTGMLTSYKGVSTEETQMIMNNEVMNHNDVPIGESFVIINKGIKGLTVKDGKVSVGCSLVISDKTGKVLLSEPDLFKGSDTYQKDKLDFLRCTVNTGEPMKWEEKYDVAVVFTDKYGKGSIENKVTIRMIDIP